MRWKIAFVMGGVVGYVLGAKAGHARYEQIARFARKVSDSPTVQEAVGVVQHQAGKLATNGKDAIVRAFRHADTELDLMTGGQRPGPGGQRPGSSSSGWTSPSFDLP